MILTNLFFYDFPIINYDIGDAADTIIKNGVEYLTNIRGRMNDWITLEDGRTFGFQPFYAVMEKNLEVIHFRVIQVSFHKIIIEIKCKEHVEQKELEKKIIDELKKTINHYEMEYEFRWLEKIEPDANGKTRFIVNKIQNNK